MHTSRVLSGMRPTGRLHLGHYHGVLVNWLKLQREKPCFFFVADWHALTTGYDATEKISEMTWEMIIDWLAAGIDPSEATLFIQSKVPEHAELFLLMSMMTPLGWLERVPSYKEQQEQLSQKDLSTYGFLGYPLLQAADILIYRADGVPVGEDQAPHIEFSREVARRFNFLYGQETGFEEKLAMSMRHLGRRRLTTYHELRDRFQEKGDEQALEQAKELIEEAPNLSLGDQERLMGHLEGNGRAILMEPQVLLTPTSKMPGLDGRKMSKSYNNTIGLREDPEQIRKKMRTMPTDPARIRRTDPGNPEKCPVWPFHLIYTDEQTRQMIRQGCQSASIGCIDCKEAVCSVILEKQKPILERAAMYQEDPQSVRQIIVQGCEKARDIAQETMKDIRQAMGLSGHSS